MNRNEFEIGYELVKFMRNIVRNIVRVDNCQFKLVKLYQVGEMGLDGMDDLT